MSNVITFILGCESGIAYSEAVKKICNCTEKVRLFGPDKRDYHDQVFELAVLGREAGSNVELYIEDNYNEVAFIFDSVNLRVCSESNMCRIFELIEFYRNIGVKDVVVWVEDCSMDINVISAIEDSGGKIKLQDKYGKDGKFIFVKEGY